MINKDASENTSTGSVEAIQGSTDLLGTFGDIASALKTLAGLA